MEFGKNIFLAIVAGLCLVATVNGWKMMDLKCLGEKFEIKNMWSPWMECAASYLSKEDMETFKSLSATKEQRMAIGKKAHNNMCIRVCMWKKSKQITDDNKLDEAKLAEKVDELVPEAARAPIKTGVKKCYDDNSKAFDDSDNCAGYKPYQECMMKVYMDACKIEKFDLEGMEDEKS